MKLDAIKTIRIDDLKNAGGDIPPWLDPMVQQLNSFIEGVGRAVQGNLTFADNQLCRIKSYKFTHAVELIINPQAGNVRVLGVLPIDMNGLAVDKFGWTRKTNGNIGVTFSFDGGTSTTVSTCTVLILLG